MFFLVHLALVIESFCPQQSTLIFLSNHRTFTVNTLVPSENIEMLSPEKLYRVAQNVLNSCRMKRAGWANMMAVKQRGAFQHLRDLEWQWYTELVLRVRGDGRTYMLNIQVRVRVICLKIHY